MVTLWVSTSFISMDQARRNIDDEIPDTKTTQDPHWTPQSLEQTAQLTRSAWLEELDRFALKDATEVQKEVFWTGVSACVAGAHFFHFDRLFPQ